MTDLAARPGRARRVLAGGDAYRSGATAEEIVARHYEGRGAEIAHRRWRGAFGEIDLIAREGTRVVIIEVKKARSHDAAAHALRPRQIARLLASAEAFLDTERTGSLTETRFDLALVDEQGRVSVIENAFGADGW